MTLNLIRSLLSVKSKILDKPVEILCKRSSSQYLPSQLDSYQFSDRNNTLSKPLELIRNFSLSSAIPKMKFVQYHKKDETNLHLGMVSEDGTQITEIPYPTFGAKNMIEFIKTGKSIEDIKQKTQSLKSVLMSDEFVLLPPVTEPQKIVCIGLNYSGHCKEQNLKPPSEPMFFSKFASTLVGATGNIIAHNVTKKIDWEVELAVIIGKEAKNVCKENAMDYVFGYSVAQDISARDWQKERNGGQFLIGKSMDSFCPLGPSIVHKSLIEDPHNLVVKCCVNGVLKQCGNTSEMIYRIDDIIARLTETITLLPGDVILTGTPGGVGMHRNPPEFLKPGDVVETEIQCIGKMRNTVVAPSC